MSQSDKSAAAYQAKARVRCTSCDKRFTLGAPHQQTLRREDGMDACAACVGCDNIRINYSYDGTAATPTTCGLRGCPGF